MSSGTLIRNTTLSDSASKTECHNLIETATGTLSSIVNADIDAAAAIAPTKLGTISTAGKVNTSALTTTGDTAGDFLYSDGTNWVRLPVGTAGQRLKASYDSYTKLYSLFDGSDGATAYTDPVAGAYTFAGTAQLDTAQKKFGTASLLLDGNSDYITLPDSANWVFGTGDFTIECWVRLADYVTSNYESIFSQYVDSSNYTQLGLIYTGSDWNIVYQVRTTTDGVKGVSANGVTMDLNTWYHIALVRSSGVCKIYLNGVNVTDSDGVTTTDIPDYASVLYVGQLGNDEVFFNGWIDELRVSKGVARWTANFTVPTAAYPLLPMWVTP